MAFPVRTIIFRNPSDIFRNTFPFNFSENIFFIFQPVSIFLIAEHVIV